MRDFSLAHLLVWYVVFLFSTTFHEYLHSLVAWIGGDSTAYEGGQVTLDPMPHIRREPMGLVVFPLISFFLWGWTVGWASAPFDPYWAGRNPKKYAAMSIAGPAGNLFLALLAFVSMKLLVSGGLLTFSTSFQLDSLVVPAAYDSAGSPVGALAMALSVLLSLNVLLGIFNLLPIPPLDGAGFVEGLSGGAVSGFYDAVRRNPGLRFLALIVSWQVFPYVANPVLNWVMVSLLSG